MRCAALGWIAGLVCVAASAALGVAPQPPRAEAGVRAEPISIVVTIAPLKGLAEALAPAGSRVTVLMPPGRSEHGYEPTPRDLANLAKADVTVRIGLGLEPRVESFVKERPRAGRIDVGMAASLGIAAEEHHEHDHSDPDHDHAAHAVDPHLWLDPSLVEAFVPHLAKAIGDSASAKGGLDDADRAALEERSRALVTKVREVDRAWREGLEPFKGRAIVTHHNAFPRPAARYGLRVAAVIRGLENAEPKPSQLEAVIAAIRRENVRAVFVEPQFNARLAERIAKAAGVRVARLDPLGDGDWFALMRSNLESLRANLGEPDGKASPPEKPRP